MRTEKLWRAIAITLCAAVPVSFYVVGDLTDAFPGVLTLSTEQQGEDSGPRAQGEDYDREQADPIVPTPATASTRTADEDLAGRLASHAKDPVIDGGLAYSVVDAESGDVIAERDADTARVPASTLKLLTASALLRSVDGDQRLTTHAVLDGRTLTLVGEGDMTLTRERVDALAKDAAKLAKENGQDQVALRLDTSALPGGENPAWGDNGRAGGWVTPTAALAVDQGWLDGEQYGKKSADPAGDAAKLFAKDLEKHGVKVSGGADAHVEGAKAPEVGGDVVEVATRSAPLTDIVQHALQTSDNTIAELMAHLTAKAQGLEPTPENAAKAVDTEVRSLADELGVPQKDLEELVIRDGSGLSTGDRVPPRLLSAILGEVASGGAPQLEPLLYDVPIAGLTGTLEERFGAKGVAGARGTVRGKTGYLAGTSALAGVTVLPDGRTVVFDIVVHGFDGADADKAKAAVDDVAYELARRS
ncbi:D-alanyl-D-alanine carboxypeptidase/D-alanyl-D-alanine-endopeptidase [Brachybacterium sp. NPDC056505]|uniref:D-alanyl-D-alanine carboxypeptidase/D-alanyl-D-alanine-endopeptidase n=1 Tax=Brachybacterium sp. NPDC056505 TaxID=3345843 RepID=UPI00366B1E1C